MKTESIEQDAVMVLHGILICGLTIITVPGSTQTLLRAVVALLAGRALVRSIRKADERWGRAEWTTLMCLAAAWSASFSPSLPFGNPDAMRTAAVAGTLVVMIRRLPAWWKVSTALGLVLAGTIHVPSHGGPLGDVEFAVGASWPRNWSDVASVAGWFVLGSAWTEGQGAVGRIWQRSASALARLKPLGALGRMPMTVLLVHPLAYALLRPVADMSGALTSVALLLAETLAAHWWMRAHVNGPVEIALQSARAVSISLVGVLRRRFVPDPIEIAR